MRRLLHCHTKATGLAWVLGLLTLAVAADEVVVENWSTNPIGTHSLPAGWQRQSWGHPAYGFKIVEDEGRQALHMRSQNENSTTWRTSPPAGRVTGR